MSITTPSSTAPTTERRIQPLWPLLGLVSIGFHLSLIFSGLVPALIARPIHMALALPWIFILGSRGPISKATGLVFFLAGEAACLYIVFNADALSDQYGFIDTGLQMAVAVTLLVVTLEMARRAIGWPLPLVALICLLYGLFGQFIPGEYGHPGFPLASYLGTLTITEGGIWGSLTGVSVGIVSIFVILGAILNAGEAGQGFMNLAGLAAGRLKGGAGKVAILSSALFGSISGSASANVASTGAITIPAMKKLGYPKALAGAVEAVASSGGQIMPPLMGAGAFVMVELTGISYPAIMGAALLPAILYFLTAWIGVDLFARRYDLKPVDVADRPKPRDVAITALFFAVPFAILLERMFVGGVTPQYAACLAILAAALLLFFDIRFRFSARRFADRLSLAAVEAGRQIAMIAAIIICASIVIGVLGLTGLGVKVTSAILAVAGEALWPALLLTALACILLGMEVPTTAAYVICVTVAGPALQRLGIEPLLAHLFVFWFALLSTITPPVCGAVFIAAGMAGENWLKVAGSAMRLGIGLYVIPLAMIANPAVIDLVEAPGAALIAFVKIAIALWALSASLIWKGALPLRALLFAGGLLLCFWPM
ncbi:MAG: TRAP transporter fused permease subunit [Fulvimarina manganoxydans]|uniref:TRAP transporter permease n=1 Tax=Fulvimarina manganoxydans TaxID=937218 RepID=UPI002357AC6D|nr:TRAP transporter fused permease subunit [Fulvimarina manganoxydans]MCK5931904.1 TRAP transporter fused permease subunit [Fulvimarina manganoxydans]MEE2950250.1 TRAP transporter fused permease subunit [Pseudomonadota bacterium]